jgi:hypothetical protein
MTVSIEYIPVTPIEYPKEDGQPIAEGDLQCSYLTDARGYRSPTSLRSRGSKR